MKKISGYLKFLSLILVLVIIYGINTKAAQTKTFNIGQIESGATISYPLGLKLETAATFSDATLGLGLELTKDANDMLLVRGTATGDGSRSANVAGVRCLSDPADPLSGEEYDLVINFEVLKDVPFEVTFVDENGNQIVQKNKTFKMGSGGSEWFNVYSFFGKSYIPGNSPTDPNEHYIVKSTQSVASTPGGQFRMNAGVPEVVVAYDMIDPGVPVVRYTLVCEKVKQQPYRINYVKQASNTLLYSEQSTVNGDNVWVDIRTEFELGSSRYRINTAQPYPASEYRYASASDAAQVCIKRAKAATSSDGYVTYNIEVYEKTESQTSRSSGSGGAGGTVYVPQRTREGWLLNNGEWYYYTNASKSNLKRGWHKDSQDGFWYYLNGADGRMLKGWNFINGEWYYLAPYTPMATWEFRSDGEWYYMNKPNSRPLGSMYHNELTPDGYKVDGNGKYVK